jgi:hypothetical protein
VNQGFSTGLLGKFDDEWRQIRVVGPMAGADFVTAKRAATGVNWSFDFKLSHLRTSFHYLLRRLVQGAMERKIRRQHPHLLNDGPRLQVQGVQLFISGTK